MVPTISRRAEPRLIVSVVAGFACAACETHPITAEVRAWPQHHMLHATAPVEPSLEPAAPGAGDVQLSGMLNETLGFWVLIEAGDLPVVAPELRVQPLMSMDGRIEPSAVRLFRAHRVPVGAFPGWHIRSIRPPLRQHRPPDVLVPIHAPVGGMPAVLDANEAYVLWADLMIPKGIPEGRYRGSIELVAEERTIAGVDIELTVWPVVLPDQAGIPLISALDHRSLIAHHIQSHGRPLRLSVDDWRQDPRGEDIDALIHATVRMLHAHGVTAVLDKLTPVAKVGPRGDFVLDWSQYDATAGPILSGALFFDRVAPAVWPLPPIAGILDPTGTGRFAGGSADPLRDYVRACGEHFASRGWIDRAHVEVEVQRAGRSGRGQTPVSGTTPFRSADAAQLAAALRRVKAATAGLEHPIPRRVRWFPQDLRPYGWTGFEHRDLSHSVDVWVTPAQFFDPTAMRAQRDEGKRTWLAIGRPPFSGSLAVHAPLSYVRVLFWQGLSLGTEALHAGRINPWPQVQGGAEPEACVQADPSTLIYPGSAFGLQEPVSSLRLKMLRRSAQDAAYVRLLREHGLDHIAGTVIDALAPRAGAEAYRAHYADGRPVGWVDDTAAFEAARATMAAELIKAVYPRRAGDAERAVERNVAWQRVLERQRIATHLDGCRVDAGGLMSERAAQIECTFSLANHARVPADVTVAFDAGAFDWLRAADAEGPVNIPPDHWRRVFLTAESDFIPAHTDGCLALPVEVGANRSDSKVTEARVCCIAAVPRAQPIHLDGDLSDWPADAANTASGFQWISGAAADGEPGPARTIVFAMSDPEHLYLAVRCDSDGDPSTLATRRNTVTYDDLVPVGEELIEVLIDPLNAGTRSPADLYHIAIKPTGAALWEKGIAFEPPVGRREAWPADIEVATRPASDHWTAELKIPRGAFDIADDRPRFWGFNVARYDAARQEFSTWSGAVGNAYDPLSVGNLYVPGDASGRERR